MSSALRARILRLVVVTLAAVASVAMPASVGALVPAEPASVAGCVYSEQGLVPIPGALVELWQYDGAGSWVQTASVTVDEYGYFSISRDTTELVRVSITDPSDMHHPLWWGGLGPFTAKDVEPGWDESSYIDAMLALVHPARIRGEVRDPLGTPWVGATVELLSAVDGWPAFEAITGATGSYDFPNVPPGDYVLLVWDDAGRFVDEYWEDASTFDDAAVIHVGSPSDIWIEPVCDPLEYTPVLTPATLVDAGAPIYIGTTFQIQTRITGVPPETPVDVERSADGIAWSTLFTDLPPDEVDPGVYRASVALGDAAPTYFRFRVASDVGVAGGASDPVMVTAAPDPSAWSRTVAKPAPGMPGIVPARSGFVAIEANLTGIDGKPDGTMSARPQMSTDGVTWTTARYEQYAAIGGLRRALVYVSERAYFRFWSPKRSTGEGHWSEPILLQPATVLTCGIAPTTVRYPKPFVVSGWMYDAHLGDPVVVEVQRPGSARWSYSSARLVYRVTFGCGQWWYRYTPKYRGTYRFRARYAGGQSGLPSVSPIRTAIVR